MSDQEVLFKAIDIAISNGWQYTGQEDTTFLPIKDWEIPGSVAVYNSYLQDKLYIPYQVFIFDHDFAKALWGEDLVENTYQGKYLYSRYDDTPHTMPAWQYHLQQLSIAEDQIQYLKDNLPLKTKE